MIYELRKSLEMNSYQLHSNFSGFARFARLRQTLLEISLSRRIFILAFAIAERTIWKKHFFASEIFITLLILQPKTWDFIKSRFIFKQFQKLNNLFWSSLWFLILYHFFLKLYNAKVLTITGSITGFHFSLYHFSSHEIVIKFYF